jgi:hypothetical protein
MFVLYLAHNKDAVFTGSIFKYAGLSFVIYLIYISVWNVIAHSFRLNVKITRNIVKIFQSVCSSLEYNTEWKIAIFWTMTPCYLVDIVTDI